MRLRYRHGLAFAAYVVLLTLVARHAYFYSLYEIDMLGYIGNAIAMTGADNKTIHDATYNAVNLEAPEIVKAHLLGKDVQSPISENTLLDRYQNYEHFAEYLPCFAIRPLFNELIYVLHYKLGIGLIRSTIVIAVASYWLIGLLTFRWLMLYVNVERAALFSSLLMLAPPIVNLARLNTPDGLSCLMSLAALYLIFERSLLFWGVTLACVSVYVRTDNVLLVLAIFCYCALVTKQLEIGKAVALSVVAIVSVYLINHFAGDYGMRMQYYRAFVRFPIAPAEFVPQFGFADYLRAFRGGVSLTLYTSFPLFAFMAAVSLFCDLPWPIRATILLTSIYAIVHFVLFPAVQERFWGSFYVAAGVALVIGATQRRLRSPAAED